MCLGQLVDGRGGSRWRRSRIRSSLTGAAALSRRGVTRLARSAWRSVRFVGSSIRRLASRARSCIPFLGGKEHCSNQAHGQPYPSLRPGHRHRLSRAGRCLRQRFAEVAARVPSVGGGFQESADTASKWQRPRSLGFYRRASRSPARVGDELGRAHGFAVVETLGVVTSLRGQKVFRLLDFNPFRHRFQAKVMGQAGDG